ncbi:S41 family peptidase [Bacteroides sp.]|uniref:S41 family peptidase n=1 Tax=Bacteroides sp. TaxID=29523 RepID=UPI0026314227|nr:S41 family peptidase [Bacteroides sp.]MDD3038451.1 S41 family peptidase [Bacteroides sp.]
MKKKSYVFSFATILIVIILSNIVLSKDKTWDQPQHDISETPTKEQIYSNVENLALLCKIWGFMKYYHPEVRAGKYDWDKELFSIIPSFNCVPSKEKRNEILTEWVNKFDIAMKIGFEEALLPNSVKMYPDIDWIKDDANLGTPLATKLKKIYNAERDTFSYYAMWSELPTKFFRNEKKYPECEFPNTSYQLLSLFRLWNVVQYYFPYKYLLKKDWNETLTDYIPLFLNIANRDDYESAVMRLATEIHDSHTNVYGNRKRNKYLIPVMVRFVEGKAMVTKYHKKQYGYRGPVDSTLQVGDILLRIKDEPIDSFVKRLTPYRPSSNKTALLRDIATLDLLWTNEKELEVEYERNGIVLEKVIKCIHKDSIKMSFFKENLPLITSLPSDILYLYMGSATGGEMPTDIKEKGVIIDLRNYPSSSKIKGYWNYELLYPSPTDFGRATYVSALYPGLFTFQRIIKEGKENKNYYQGPKVILVNEVTQSHAEFMAMKYRCTPNTIVMGSQTAGADGNITNIALPGYLFVTFTGLGVYYPDKSETQQIGIIPDIEVKSTIQGIREGRDEVLEAAVKYINNQIKLKP